MTSVFVSSTVYDLVDVRAEVRAHLVGMGLKAVLSDHPTSDFSKVPDANSIETCLVNVRRSDYFVLILDQRYGHSLQSAGFADVSATHLELQTAREKNLSIHVYVRDRLEADYGLWKKQDRPDTFSGAWVKDSRDLPLLRLLDEHARLDTSDRSNWYSTFRDSVDLKEQLSKDFKQPALHARLLTLTRCGQLPVVRPYYEGRAGNVFKFGGQIFEGVALAVQTRSPASGRWQAHGDLSNQRQNFVVKHEVASLQLPMTFQLFVRYETVWGDSIEDCYQFTHGSDDIPSEQRIVYRQLLGDASYLNTVDSGEKPA